MTAYFWDGLLVIRAGAYGLTVNAPWWRPSWERFNNGDWYIHGCRLALWRDTVPEMTVGERGVW